MRHRFKKHYKEPLHQKRSKIYNATNIKFLYISLIYIYYLKVHRVVVSGERGGADVPPATHSGAQLIVHLHQPTIKHNPRGTNGKSP